MCNYIRMINKVFVILLILGLIHTAKGLKCRVETDEKTYEGIQDVVRACMNMRDEGTGKERNRNGWQQWRKHNQETQWNSNNGNEREDGGQEQMYKHTNRQTNNNNNRNQNENRQFGNQNEKRQFGNQNDNRQYGGQNENRSFGNRNFFNQRNNHTSQNNHRKNSSPLEEIDPCIVHCIFRQMKMLDDNSQPEKSSVISVMTQHIRDPELKDFIEESVTECFDETESEDPDGNNCNLSKSFAMCLEKKGEQNCEDWNEDMSKNKQNKHNGTNNLNNRRKG